MLYAGNPEELEGWNCRSGDLETSSCSFLVEDTQARYSLQTECTFEHKDLLSCLPSGNCITKELINLFKAVLPSLGD